MHGTTPTGVIYRRSDTRRPKIAEQNHKGGVTMLMKIGGLARAIAIILAIVGGFVALTMMNLPLVLVVLGLIAGLAMPADRLVLTTVTLIALPMIGRAATGISTGSPERLL